MLASIVTNPYATGVYRMNPLNSRWLDLDGRWGGCILLKKELAP